MHKPPFRPDAGGPAHDPAHEHIGMELALYQPGHTAVLDKFDGRSDCLGLTIRIDNFCAGKVPADCSCICCNLRGLANQKRCCQPGSSRITRCLQGGRSGGAHEGEWLARAIRGQCQKIIRASGGRRAQKRGSIRIGAVRIGKAITHENNSPCGRRHAARRMMYGDRRA